MRPRSLLSLQSFHTSLSPNPEHRFPKYKTQPPPAMPPVSEHLNHAIRAAIVNPAFDDQPGTSANSSASGSTNNIGSIAAGVVGAIIVIILVVSLVCVARRQEEKRSARVVTGWSKNPNRPEYTSTATLPRYESTISTPLPAYASTSDARTDGDRSNVHDLECAIARARLGI